MEKLHPRCAGLDVHKDSVVACVRIQEGPQAVHRVETFGTTTQELLKLSDWLSGHQVTHVAMEATGVYWKPVWHGRIGPSMAISTSLPSGSARSRRRSILWVS